MAKILVIDDEPSILIMIKKMLEREGHLVDTAANGRDIIMPQKEGLEIILELRKKHPKLKIVAISGGGRIGPEGYLPSAKLFGADMVFQKPLVKNEFVEAISKLLSEA
jgi:CheY-like chemotaxis protein